MNIETGRTKATASTENIHTHVHIQKERNRWICRMHGKLMADSLKET